MRTRSTTSSVSVCSSTSTGSYDRELRAGVESYSIKRLEKLIGFERSIDSRTRRRTSSHSKSALEEGEAAEDLETRKVVAGYNEDDCRATLALRDWLEARRV